MKPIALALIEVEILLIFSLKSKRLERIAGNSSLLKFQIQFCVFGNV